MNRTRISLLLFLGILLFIGPLRADNGFKWKVSEKDFTVKNPATEDQLRPGYEDMFPESYAPAATRKGYAVIEMLCEGEVKVIFSGQKKAYGKSIVDYETLRDRAGREVVFATMQDAMNYMARDGWELYQAYGYSFEQGGYYRTKEAWIIYKK